MPSTRLSIIYLALASTWLASAEGRKMPEIPKVLEPESSFVNNLQRNMLALSQDFCRWCVKLCMDENPGSILWDLEGKAEIGYARPPFMEPAFLPNIVRPSIPMQSL